MAEEAGWVLVPGAEAAEQAAAAPQVGAAARAVREVCGRLANLVRQPVVGRVVAVREAAEPAQAGLAVEVETAVVAASALVVAQAAAEDPGVEDLAVAELAVAGEPAVAAE